MKENKSPMGAMLKDAFILFVITLVAGLVLGLVNMVTVDAIAKQEEETKKAAWAEVFPDAKNFAETELKAPGEDFTAKHPGSVIDAVIEAQDDSGKVLGYVVTVTNKEGFGGNIQFSLGIREDGTLNGMSILSIAETAGLGMRAEEVLKPQFDNVQAKTFTTKGLDAGDVTIDAITGATITSKAVVNGVNAGMDYYLSVLKGGN